MIKQEIIPYQPTSTLTNAMSTLVDKRLIMAQNDFALYVLSISSDGGGINTQGEASKHEDRLNAQRKLHAKIDITRYLS